MGGHSKRLRTWRWLWLGYAVFAVVTALAFRFVRKERVAPRLEVAVAAVQTMPANEQETEAAPANPSERTRPRPGGSGRGGVPAPALAPHAAMLHADMPGVDSAHGDQLTPPRVSENEAEDREYARDRRELMFEELETAWLGETAQRERSDQVRREVVDRLREFGPVEGVAADCRTTLCKISVPVTSDAMARQAELLATPQQIEQIIKIVGDPARGVIDRVELYRVPKERLQQLMGDHIEEALTPGSLGPTAATTPGPAQAPANDDHAPHP